MKRNYTVRLTYEVEVQAENREDAKVKGAEKTPSKTDLTNVEVAY